MISTTSLFSLVMLTFISTLTAFILVIVYVGAIIVLIGYICAVRPNLVLEPDYTFVMPLLFSLLLFILIAPITCSTFTFVLSSLSDFYYS